MSEQMTHGQYVASARRQAVEIAAGMLAGEIHVLTGCISLTCLWSEVEVADADADFSTFAMISSEIDALPVGAVRARWAPEALARLESQIQSAVAWASPQALSACASLVKRFGA